jgi:hypothetical protein
MRIEARERIQSGSSKTVLSYNTTATMSTDTTKTTDGSDHEQDRRPVEYADRGEVSASAEGKALREDVRLLALLAIGADCPDAPDPDVLSNRIIERVEQLERRAGQLKQAERIDERGHEEPAIVVESRSTAVRLDPSPEAGSDVMITELDGDDEDRPDRRTDRSEDVDDG